MTLVKTVLNEIVSYYLRLDKQFEAFMKIIIYMKNRFVMNMNKFGPAEQVTQYF